MSDASRYASKNASTTCRIIGKNFVFMGLRPISIDWPRKGSKKYVEIPAKQADGYVLALCPCCKSVVKLRAHGIPRHRGTFQ